MVKHFTANELKAIAHRFHPAGLEGNDPRHAASEEFQRMLAAREAAMRDTQAWDRFFQQFQESAPDCRVENWSTVRYDACRRCRLHLPGTQPTSTEVKAVVGLVSIIAPVFAIYASRQTFAEKRVVSTRIGFPPLPAEFQALEARLDALIRESFGFERLSDDILMTPVTDLQVGNKAAEDVRLIDCLFTDDLW